MKKLFIYFSVASAGLLTGLYLGRDNRKLDLPEEFRAIEKGDILVADSVTSSYVNLAYMRDPQITHLPECYGENISTDLFQIDSISLGVVYMSFYNDSTVIGKVD